ncbi:MAG: hypothetical protein HN405_08500 [Planctomycetes bacterium]|jgi:16S rRNA (guanine527-N7)-methyltransferase|nr:hypothetical protein [Planctomycetota bacterium]MBT4029667.1 hypothetical protein [Planctomycetota bacterium]MBT4561167.1 hypothetical protein [Planctomycetota bacterium]MBT5100732.1 hypothetical protein [Planctomycetota bacterium]MBT7319531.1 hypothetical protein [Planctomycetota bacterium]
MAFPGIPEDILGSLEEPNPIDLGVLREAVAAIANPPDAALQAVVDYGRVLLAANTVTNLTGAKDWQTLIESHLLDCIYAAAHLPEDLHIVADWGSGGGLPGLVWAALFPEKQFLLLERNGKKAAFLDEAILHLGWVHAEVLTGQGEETLRLEEDAPEVVVARAVEPLPKLLRRMRKAQLPFRTLIVMAGSNWEEAWEQVEPSERAIWKLAATHPYELPANRGKRALLVFRRTRK